MNFFLKTLRRLSVALIATLFVLIVLSQVALRLLLPHADEQRVRLEKELSNFLHSEVSIERIDSHWNFLVPYLDLVNVQVRLKKEGQENQAQPLLKRLSIGVNLFDMFRAGSIAPSTLEIDGLNVLLAKRTDGSFYFPYIDLPDQNKDKTIDWDAVLSHKVVSLSNGSFQLYDEKSQKTLSFSPIDLNFFSGDGEYEGELSWQPPRNMGGKAKITFDVDGVSEKIDSWRGLIDLHVPELQLKALKAYWPEKWNLKDASLALQLGVEITDHGMNTRRGNIKTHVEFSDAKKISWESPVYVDAEAGLLSFQMKSPLMLDQHEVLDGVDFKVDLKNDLTAGLVVDQLDINKVINLLSRLQMLPEPWSKRIQKMQLQGKLVESFAGWKSKKGWTAKTHLENFSNSAIDRIPSLSALNANIEFNGENARFSLNEQSITIDTNGLFPKPFDIQRLHGDLFLNKESDTWVLQSSSIFIDTPDIKTHSDFTMNFSKNKKPYLTMHAKAQDGKVESVANYVPTTLSEGTLSWFRQAFLGGTVLEASAYIDGYVNDIARNNSSTIFKLNGKISKGKLSYARNWPIVEDVDGLLLMDGARLEVIADKARVYNLRPRYAKAVMPNTRKSSLELYIKAPHSPMKDLLKYVNESPISQLIGNSGELFSANGHADIVLDLKKNISHKHYDDLRAYFDGKLRFQDASLNLDDLKLNFEKLTGFVEFSDKHVNADKLTGTMNHQNFDGSIKTVLMDSKPRANLKLNTRLSLNDVFREKISWLSDKTKGRASWELGLEIPLSASQTPPKLTAQSNLSGIAIQLPKPLSKSPAIKQLFNATMNLRGHKKERVYFTLGDNLSADLMINTRTGSLASGNIRYLMGEASAPSKGLTLAMNVDDIDLDKWLAVGQGVAKEAGIKSPLDGIQLSAKKARYSGYVLDDFSLGGAMSNGVWQIDMEAKGIKGQAQWSVVDDQKAIIDMQRLNLNKVTADRPNGNQISPPKGFPIIKVNINDFQWNNIKLQGIQADLGPVAQGVSINSYQVTDNALVAKGNGTWVVDKSGQQKTSLSVNFDSPNLQPVLSKFGVNNLLKQGKAKFNGQLEWAGAPHHVDWGSLSGSLSGEVNEGELLGVNPGAAKLLGLLNVESIPKRLSLNFDDLNSKGFAFDKADMGLRLDDGIVHFDRMKIRASLADVYIEGRADLVKEELNQIAKVNPDVSNIIPVTAGVVGGLPGLVGALLVDRVVKALGGNTDEVAQVRYSITGSWHDPVVKTTSVKRVKDMTPEQIRKRAEEIVIKSQGVDYGQDVVPGELELSEDEEEQIFLP